MEFLVSLLLTALSVFATAYLVPGVTVNSFGTSLVVAIVLGVMNAFVKPILILLTLPINILTLGLFTLVINLFILYLTDWLVPGFDLQGLIPTILFAIVLSVINSALVMLMGQSR